MMEMISREKLEHVARKVLKYPLHDAEKDYFLTIVMKIVSESTLSETLVFKGGTSIYHCYLEQLRFSEDLDFTSQKKGITLKDIERLFVGYLYFEIKKKYESEATLKIERLKYTGVLDTANSLKVEVDRLQNIAIPARNMPYKNVWDLNFFVNVMDPIEICAEKIRACNDRFRYRDFYDLYMMVNKIKIDINQVKAIISQKEIRKQISQDNIMRNLELAINEVNERGDTVEYRESIKTNMLTQFIRSLHISQYAPNI